MDTCMRPKDLLHNYKPAMTLNEKSGELNSRFLPIIEFEHEIWDLSNILRTSTVDREGSQQNNQPDFLTHLPGGPRRSAVDSC